MKKLILALALTLSASVMAEPVAFMPNNSGGKIVMTNDRCTGKNGKVYEGMWRIYTYNQEGVTTEGCFAFEGDTIRVFWPETQQERRYVLERFEMYKK